MLIEGLIAAGAAGELGLDASNTTELDWLACLGSDEVRLKLGAVGLLTSNTPPPEVVS
jgi:hypothetical protein